MNTTQKEKFLELVLDYLIDSKNIRSAKSFVIKAYSGKANTKIPITFQIDETPIENLVIDFYQQTILDECSGFNDYGEFIRLNCDLQKMHEIGYINYYLDQDITDTLNASFAPPKQK